MTPDHVGRVFLSYRREETAHLAGRLADRMNDRFGSGQVFMDVDAIEPGVDFAAAITRAVSSCDVLVVIIGRNWLKITDRHGRRKLDDPTDFVVLEIQAALNRDIRVIPVLVDGADMPGHVDLPEVLHKLAHRNAVRLDHDTFRSDVGHLLAAVERILIARPNASPTDETAATRHAPALGSPAGDPRRPELAIADRPGQSVY